MHFYLIGIDYKRVPINVRDTIYQNRKAISDFWESYDPAGTAILITCNRIEIYGVAEYPDDAFGHIANFSKNFLEFSKYSYLKSGKTEVLRHAIRLASGLESQLKGEQQIFVQLNKWRISSTLPVPLEALWDEAISLSEKVRIASKLNEKSPNMATLVLDDIGKRLERQEEYRIIVVGTGKIAELFAEYKSPKARITFLANKNYRKAQALAKHAGGEALLLQDLPRVIDKADVLISATTSPHYVVKKDIFEGLQTDRKHPLYIYDLAIPRDVEPAVGGIGGIYLYNLDSLEYLFHGHNKSGQDRIELASDLIEDFLRAHRKAVYDKSH